MNVIRYPGKLIGKLHRKNQMYWTQELKEYEIASSEFSVLILLNKRGELTQEEIAKELAIDKSAIARVIKSMIEKGFVERKKDQSDQRCKRVHLTEKGQLCNNPIEEGMKHWEQMVLKGITDEEMLQFNQVLEKMMHNVELGMK